MRQAASISASLASSFAMRRLLRMHNVGYDCGQIAAAEIGDALLLEREARPDDVVSALAQVAAAQKTMLTPASSDSV